MNKNQNTEEDLVVLLRQVKECHRLDEKRAERFVKQILALQKNTSLRKKQKQDRENQKKSSDK